MHNNERSVVAGLVCGIFFESIISAPAKGFYFIPIIFFSIVFVVLPFTAKVLNIIIAWLFGVATMSVWALVVSDGRAFSFRYFVHFIIVITLSAIIVYASTYKK